MAIVYKWSAACARSLRNLLCGIRLQRARLHGEFISGRVRALTSWSSLRVVAPQLRRKALMVQLSLQHLSMLQLSQQQLWVSSVAPP